MNSECALTAPQGRILNEVLRQIREKCLLVRVTEKNKNTEHK